ncbi:MAG: hypothetical protein WC587_02310 [Candidatus Paceibacterota bacterium]
MEKIYKNKSIISITLSVFLSVLFVAAAVNAATTIGTNIDTGGTLTATGLTTLGNASTSVLTVSGNSYVGTVSSGVWSGTAIGVAKGGTGLTSYTLGDVLYASGTGTLAGTSTPNLKTTLGLNLVNNTSDASKPVSTAQQTALDLKSNLASPTFTGTVTIPTPFTLGAVSVLPTGTELNFVDGVTSAIQTQLDAKQGTLTNSAGLLAALSDETGTGVAVFSTSPSFTTGITTPAITLGATALTSSGTELNYVTGVTSAIQTQIGTKQGTLTNSAGLLAALSDETGTGLAVFNNAPTLITPVLGTGGTAITKHLSVTQANIVSASIAAVTCGSYSTITVTGAAVGDTVIASPTAVASGIETINLGWSAAVTGAGVVTIRACNPTAVAIDALDTQTWRADVWQH